MKSVYIVLMILFGSLFLPLNAEELKARIDLPGKYHVTSSTPGHVSFFGSASGGIPPYTFLWEFGEKTGSSQAEDPGIVIIRDKGLLNIRFTVTDSKGDTAQDLCELLIDDKNPHTRIYSPLPGAVTNDTSKYEVKGFIDIDGDEGWQFLKSKGVKLEDVPFAITIVITPEGSKPYMTQIHFLSAEDKKNNFFSIEIGKWFDVKKGEDKGFKIEPIGIDPAGNGLWTVLNTAVRNNTKKEVVTGLLNIPGKPNGFRAHDILAYLTYKDPLVFFNWILDNWASLNTVGRMNAILGLRIAEKVEIYEFLVQQAKDKTKVVNEQNKTDEKYMRICDYAFNTFSYMMTLFNQPGKVAVKVTPDMPEQLRDKYVGDLLRSWQQSKEMFYKHKQKISTEKLDLFSKLKGVKNIPAPRFEIAEKKEEVKLTPAQMVDKAYREFYKGMSSEDETERQKAFDVMMPDEASVKVLFGEDAGMLWPRMKEAVADLRLKTGKLKDEICKGGPILGINVRDIRSLDEAKGKEEMLEYLPKDIPLFRITVEKKNGGPGSSVYVVIDGEVKHFRGLSGMVRYIIREKNK